MINQTKSASIFRRIGAAEAFCDARLALGRVTHSLTDLVKESGLSAIAAKRQFSRLRGKVVRISPRQPFFLIVSPEHRSMGAPPANWWLHDYFDWLGRPYYLALQSAASSFGSNPQALQVTQVMTNRPRRAIKVGRIHGPHLALTISSMACCQVRLATSGSLAMRYARAICKF